MPSGHIFGMDETSLLKPHHPLFRGRRTPQECARIPDNPTSILIYVAILTLETATTSTQFEA